jgi:hypothetical protein
MTRRINSRNYRIAARIKSGNVVSLEEARVAPPPSSLMKMRAFSLARACRLFEKNQWDISGLRKFLVSFHVAWFHATRIDFA